MEDPKSWKQRIIEAGERGFFLPEEKRQAAHWECCAIGEMRYKLGLNPEYPEAIQDTIDELPAAPLHGIPYYGKDRSSPIYELGIEFCNAVEDDGPGEAMNIIDRIEALSPEKFQEGEKEEGGEDED